MGLKQHPGLLKPTLMISFWALSAVIGTTGLQQIT